LVSAGGDVEGIPMGADEGSAGKSSHHGGHASQSRRRRPHVAANSAAGLIIDRLFRFLSDDRKNAVGMTAHTT
jgi:hypothetical protein